MSGTPVGDRRLWRPAAVFVCVAVGLCVGRWVTPAPGWSALVGALCAAVACAPLGRTGRGVLLALGAVLMSAAWWSVRIENNSARGLLEAAEALERRSIVAVEGVVRADGRTRPIGRGVFAEFAREGVTTHARLDGVRFVGDEEGRLRGSVWVSVAEETDALRAGERVRVWGRLSAAGTRRNPGDPPYRLRALESGAVAFLHAPSAASIERLGSTSWWRSARARVKARATRWLEPARDDDDARAALLLAALTGERVEALHEADVAVRRVGAAHLLAISGLHLAFLVTIGVRGARMVRDPGRLEPLIGAGLALVYLALTPARAPIVRAAMLTVALMIGEAAGTRWRREALLAWAATLTVLWRPMELFSPGFQLSYGCVLALVMFAGPVKERLFGERLLSAGRENWFVRNAKSGVAAAVVAWLVATPITAHHFGMVNPLGVLVVILATPVFCVVLGLGFVASAFSLIWPALGAVVGEVALWMSEWFLAGVLFAESLPGMVVYTPAAPVWLVVTALGAAVWWMWAERQRRVVAGVFCALGVCVGGWLWVADRTEGLDGEVALRVDMLDVGDGTFVVVRSGGEAMLWDAGAQSLAFGRREAPASLRELGVWRAREALVTHANLDHFSALPDVAERIGLRRVRTTGAFIEEANATGTAAGLLVEELGSDGVVVEETRAGDSFVLGDARVEVLWPFEGSAFEAVNNLSLVVRVSVETDGGVRAVLLTGDIEPEAARTLLAAHPGLRAGVLELPHHGSARLAGEGFVETVDPAVVLQSSGRSRLGDERWDGAKLGREWLMTAEAGAAWVEIARDGEVRSGAVRR